MTLDLVVPTRSRLEKLNVCVDSLKEASSNIQEKTNIIIYVDEDEYDITSKTIKQVDEIRVLKEEFLAAKFWNNHLKNMTSDILCYLTDDIKMDKYCLKFALEALKKLDYDGLVGFNQVNQKGNSNCNAAFGLFSLKFADRFPNREVFYPEYSAFYLDEELMKYAISINKFIYCEDAKLEHYHPAFTGDKPDSTYFHHRRYKSRDIEIYRRRQEKNLIWGISFEK